MKTSERMVLLEGYLESPFFWSKEEALISRASLKKESEMAEVEQGYASESLETLTVDEICGILKASRSTVQRLIRRGEIQALPVNAPQDKSGNL